MANISAIFSAIGNNSSLTPILLKDGAESSVKVGLAYKQGSKVSKQVGYYESREWAIEEFGTSALWFFGPKYLSKAFDKYVTKNVFKLTTKSAALLDKDLLNGKHYQSAAENLKKVADNELKHDIEKIIANPKLFKGFVFAKGVFAILGTLVLMIGLTNIKQKITEKSIKKLGLPKGLITPKHGIENDPSFTAFIRTKSQPQKKDISFGGFWSGLAIDAGIGGYRIKSARSEKESKEYAFRTTTFIAACYLSGKLIEKTFNKIAKATKMPIALDAKVLGDKGLKEAIKQPTFADFVKIADGDTSVEKKVIDFIDEQLKTAVKVNQEGNFVGFKNATLEYARQLGLIDVVGGKRSATKFINTEAVQSLNKNLKELAETVLAKGNVDKFVNQIKHTKYGAIVANLLLSGVITAYVVPKAQYWYREKFLKTTAAPGITSYGKA